MVGHKHPASQGSFGIEFSEASFASIAQLARQRFGINLPATKKSLVYSRLSPRLRALGLPSMDDYVTVVENQKNVAENDMFASALTTNVTHFFREEHHFEFLRHQALPDLINVAAKGGKVRIWSAGCSTGEEPYSIAMLLLDVKPEIADLDVKILATDLDKTALNKAKAGKFDAIDITKLDPSILTKTPKQICGMHFIKN